MGVTRKGKITGILWRFSQKYMLKGQDKVCVRQREVIEPSWANIEWWCHLQRRGILGNKQVGGWKSRDLVKLEICKGRHDSVGHSIFKFRDICVGDMPVGVISIYVVMRWGEIRRKGSIEFGGVGSREDADVLFWFLFFQWNQKKDHLLRVTW